MYYYKFKGLGLEGSINFDRKIINCEKRATYECPHVKLERGAYFPKAVAGYIF